MAPAILSQDIMKFFVQMLLSLQHVHSKLVLHRDLKTQNILMDKRRETIKLGDFGISKVLSSKSKAYTVSSSSNSSGQDSSGQDSSGQDSSGQDSSSQYSSSLNRYSQRSSRRGSICLSN